MTIWTGQDRTGQDRTGQDRDNTLDTFRAIAILWVVSLVHNIYHLGYFTNGVAEISRSYILFEMPLFFFIVGASNSYGRKKQLTGFYASRLKRILIPYWLYAAICFGLSLLCATVKSVRYDFLENAIRWMLPLDIQYSPLPFLTWSLWFIPVYLGVIAFFPLMKYIFDKTTGTIRIMPLPVLAACIVALRFVIPEQQYLAKLWDIGNKIVFYSFFVYLGLFWRLIRTEKSKVKPTVIAIACGFALSFAINIGGFSLSIQDNKFPPNIIYLLYGVCALAIIYLFKNVIMAMVGKIRKNKFVDFIFTQYTQSCYSIFLYHSFSILAARVIIELLRRLRIIGDMLPIWLLPFTIAFTVVISAILGWLFGEVEKIK